MSKNQGDLGPTIYSISNLISQFNKNDFADFKNQEKSYFRESGFDQFDNTLCFEPGSLLVFASVPAMGKKALSFSIIDKMTIQNAFKVRYFSNGELADDVFKRYILTHTEKSTSTIQKELKDPQKSMEFLLTIKELMSKKLIIDDEKFQDYTELVERIRHDQLTHKSTIYFIDSILQLGTCGKSKREMNHCLKVLKQLAVEFNCVIVVLSHIDRTIEKRKKRIPKLSDLTSFGAFDRYADFIGFLHRPEYYGFLNTKKGKSTGGKMTIFIKRLGGRKHNTKFRFNMFCEIYKVKEIDWRNESN